MKLVFLFIAIIYCSLLSIHAQDFKSKNSFLFTTGITLEDGFIYNINMPIIGLGYNHKLNNTFSMDIGLNSIYKILKDVTYLGAEAINIATRNSQSLFISQHDRDNIIEKGIKDLASEGTVKYLYLPLNLSLNIRPLRIKSCSLGISVGTTAIYGSYKASRDEFTMDITLKDGTLFENVTLKQEIEFRNLIVGGSYSRLYFMYDFGDRGLQLSLHSYNFLWSPTNTETNHLLTLSYIVKI
jgi:hypothetical protein